MVKVLYDVDNADGKILLNRNNMYWFIIPHTLLPGEKIKDPRIESMSYDLSITVLINEDSLSDIRIDRGSYTITGNNGYHTRIVLDLKQVEELGPKYPFLKSLHEILIKKSKLFTKEEYELLSNELIDSYL